MGSSRTQDWIDYGTGEKRSADSCDFATRGFIGRAAHKAYWGTGSITTGVAAALPGTVVHDVVRKTAVDAGVFRIGHPSCVIRVDIELHPSTSADGYEVRRGELLRTARKLMDGLVYVASDRLTAPARLRDTRAIPNGGRSCERADAAARGDGVVLLSALDEHCYPISGTQFR